MKQAKILFTVTTVTLFILSSCTDFLETNLSKKKIVLNSPADNAISALFEQTFWWEEVKGANEYQIQIVKPSFSSIQQFVIDTSVAYSKFKLTLSPGTYQWRVRAKNSTSTTDYVTRTLTIDSTLNLAGQSLPLTSPIDNKYTNQLSIAFTWQTMPNALNYVFQILDGSSPIYTHTGNTTSCSYTASGEGSYQWRVFAQNSTSNSSYYTRNFVIDTTKPVIPSVLLPLTDTTSSEPVHLQWSNVESDLSYRLVIATDSNFSSVYKDTTMLGNDYNLQHLVSGQNYYWRIKAIDKALNESAFTIRKHLKKN